MRLILFLSYLPLPNTLYLVFLFTKKQKSLSLCKLIIVTNDKHYFHTPISFFPQKLTEKKMYDTLWPLAV